tara:strand:+ start:1271 stop:1900 length:630 start_codon:yes stop_codon:yes gene_type:complete
VSRDTGDILRPVYADSAAHIRRGTRMEGMRNTTAHEQVYSVYDGTSVATYTEEGLRTLNELTHMLLNPRPEHIHDGTVHVARLVGGPFWKPDPSPVIAATMERYRAERAANPPPPECEHVYVPGSQVLLCRDCTGCFPLDEPVPDGPIYECGSCGLAAIGEDGRSCDNCHRFNAKIFDATVGVCPDCEEAPLDAVPGNVCTKCGDQVPA